MADLNDLTKPDAVSNYSTEVLQTIKGHIARLWSGDYTGMGGLVTGMRRWIDIGAGNAKLVSRGADGLEATIFDSSSKAATDGANAGGTWPISISKNAATANSANAIFNTGGWSVKQVGGKLVFSFNGTAVGSFDQTGNFVTAGNVTAYGVA